MPNLRQNLEGATTRMKAREIERFKPQTPLKKWRERGGLLTISSLERKYFHWISV
jgi:hypothetical protein